MMKKFLFSLIFLSFFSCSDFAVSKTGTAGNKCFENSTCLNDLTCQEGICVDLTSDNKCTKDEIKWVTCPTDLEKVLKQTCDSKGEWISSDECEPCQEGIERDAVCESDVSKLQKQVCDSNAHWIDKGECFDPNADEENDEDVIDTGNTGDTGDTGNTGNTGNSGNSEETCGEGRTICTGQSKCYNNTEEITCPLFNEEFYGQDAQYSIKGCCIPRNYTVSGTEPEEIVTDDNTGLQWQRTASESTFTWDNAIVNCDELVYGGHSDWRLPTRKELATLPDYGKYSPAIDTGVFFETQKNYYWSSSPIVYNNLHAWHVSFDDGYMNFFNKTFDFYVYCVRGEILNNIGNFEESTVSAQVIVTDTDTGLEWTKEYVTDKTWQQALDYCETLSYGVYTDWRLPNIEELKTLIDDSISEPASSFPEMPSSIFWSSSSMVSYPVNAWYVDFINGSGSSNKTNVLYVRCVR